MFAMNYGRVIFVHSSAPLYICAEFEKDLKNPSREAGHANFGGFCFYMCPSYLRGTRYGCRERSLTKVKSCQLNDYVQYVDRDIKTKSDASSLIKRGVRLKSRRYEDLTETIANLSNFQFGG